MRDSIAVRMESVPRAQLDEVVRLARIPERVRAAVEMQSWDPARRRAWVDARLTEQLEAARVTRHGSTRVGARDGEPRGRLAAVEPIGREDLRRHFEELRAAASGPLIPRRTSGSSGRPVRVLHGPDTVGWAAAGRLRQLAWFGLEPRDHPQLNVRIASRAGDELLVREPRRPPLFWMNPYRLDAAAADRVHDALMAAGGIRLAGAESSMLARWAAAAAAGERDPRELGLRLAIAGGEMTYPEQRRAAGETFGCRVAEMYGSHELSLLGTECPAGSLHVCEEAVLVELLDEQARPVCDGRAGEVVVTLLHNREMPLLRYRLGDVAVAEPGPCPCGSTLRRLRVTIGRLEEMVRAADGSLVHPRFLRSIYEQQFGDALRAFHTTQPRPGEFHVRIELDGELPDGVERRLAAAIAPYVGAHPSVTVVAGEARPPAGKLRTFTYAG